jgi:hypothetical protein
LWCALRVSMEHRHREIKAKSGAMAGLSILGGRGD